jgi:hypothetical protein
VFAHFAESIDHTGPLSEHLGQWIEDECLLLVSQTRRRDIKVNPDATLAKTIALKHLLREKHHELDKLEDFLPVAIKNSDPSFYDDGDDGQQLLGKGVPITASAELLSDIAKLLSILLQRPKVAVEAGVIIFSPLFTHHSSSYSSSSFFSSHTHHFSFFHLHPPSPSLSSSPLFFSPPASSDLSPSFLVFIF